MSNVLKVNQQELIRTLKERGWSERKIAQELGLNRRTVRRYAAKCTSKVTAGNEEFNPKCTSKVTAGTEIDTRGVKAVISRSQCQAYGEQILEKLEVGLSAQRVYQDLKSEQRYEGSYESVKRFVAVLKAKEPRRVWRMECQPGEEMQVDFGLGAMLVGADGKRKRSWVLRAVLSHSRKGYSEAVYHQNTETFIRVLENAFRHMGGVPVVVTLDNLKAAVIKADWFDPELNPKLADFARHYGFRLMPCRPRKPEHKGKVERGVAYVRNNALKGRHFSSLDAENAHLAHWESHVADLRIHGTTCKQVKALFEEERLHLGALPASLFPCYQEARRTVGRDSFVEVAKAFYEAPPEYIGNRVWVRWDTRVVRILSERCEQVQIYTRQEPGKFSRVLGCGGMSRPVLASCKYWVERMGLLGEGCQQWAQNAVDTRGPEALRSIMGLWDLRQKHTAASLNAACQQATDSGAKRFKDIKRLLGKPTQPTLDFQETHPLIRDLGVYGDFITTTTKATTNTTATTTTATTHHHGQNTENHSDQTATLRTA
jgi:transposase